LRNEVELLKKQNTLLFALLSASFAIIIFLTGSILQNVSFTFERTIYEFLRSTFSTDWLHGLELLSFTASKPAIISISLLTMLILWFRTRDYAGIIAVFVFVFGGNVLNKLIKNWTQRERPAMNGIGEGYSFPSGHVMIGFIMYGLIVYLIYHHSPHPLLKTISLIIGTLLLIIIGVSRIATGEHYATDVVAGYAFGVLILVIAMKVHQSIVQGRRAKQQVDTSF
jgi:undecaprenyl-diphosphatase